MHLTQPSTTTVTESLHSSSSKFNLEICPTPATPPPSEFGYEFHFLFYFGAHFYPCLNPSLQPQPLPIPCILLLPNSILKYIFPTPSPTPNPIRVQVWVISRFQSTFYPCLQHGLQPQQSPIPCIFSFQIQSWIMLPPPPPPTPTPIRVWYELYLDFEAHFTHAISIRVSSTIFPIKIAYRRTELKFL